MFPFISDAMAQSAGGTSAQNPLIGMIPFLLIFIVFYFLIIRPQQKKQKSHQEMLDALKKGDRVVTSGGIHGTVYKLGDNVVTVEIADKVRIQVDRPQIANCVNKPDSKSESDKK